MDITNVGFTVECLPEEIPIRGNCLASGDDAVDEACAVEIEQQLEAGNQWAWCSVTVTATWNGLEASDYLGGCSYDSEEGFKQCPYYSDMRDQAFALLQDMTFEPGDEVIVREEVNHKVASVDREAKTATLENGSTVPWDDMERYNSL